MSRVTHRDRARIVQLRGLGYSQKEVAEDVGVSRQTVSYHLGKLKEEAEEVGVDEAFRDVILSDTEMAFSLVAPLLREAFGGVQGGVEV